MALKNLDKLIKRFRAMPDAVQAAVRIQMEAAATSIVAQMKSIAPEHSGNLKASIGWTWGAAPAGSLAVGTVGGPGGISITIHAGDATTIVTNQRGAQFQNARLQEFGTKKMTANPFFFPVFRANRRGFTARINAAARKAMRATWGK